MTDIATTLSELDGELATLQAGLASATAQGNQATSVASATRGAAAAIQSLAARTKAEAAQIDADGALVAAALSARNTALAAAAAARTEGAHPPLSDAEAMALRKAVADANGVSEGDLDSKGVAAVTTLDDAVDGLGDAEAAQLKTAQDDLTAKRKALADARDAALRLLAQIQGGAAELTERLNAARSDRESAQQLGAAGNAASHHAAVVAYADYAAARKALADDAAADPNGSVTQGKWNAAATAWKSALADAAAAEEKVVERQLALDAKLAERAAKRQTRDTDAAGAVAAAIGP